MPPIRYRISRDDRDLLDGFAAIRAELQIPERHHAAAVAEAAASAAAGPHVPEGADGERIDRRDLALVAIDPVGARDLDQAYGAQRRGDGYRVHYAIADVAALVAPGSLVEAESLTRGVTLYCPDMRASLHPDIINEDAASLLPGVDRPALLWEIDLDADGELIEARVTRATVRVDQAMSYVDAQSEIDGDDPREALTLLAEIGRLREALEVARGAVSLNLPSQEIVATGDGHYELVYDETLPVEGWNAQISLLTGMAAARIMLDSGIGMLRTLPPADDETLAGLRRTAHSLGIAWPESQGYADRLRSLDPNERAEVTLISRGAKALRGAGYLAFTSADELPAHYLHSAIAAPYAHVTAPLRRVCDRYANEILLALCADREPPAWAVARLGELPSVMGRTRQREGALERAIVDFMEATLLASDVGAEFDAVVVNRRGDTATILVRSPAVIGQLEPKPPLGAAVRVRLAAVDIGARHLHFERVE